MTLTYGSVCSGIEAATVAWGPLGWRAAFFSEIEPFPSAVLAHHYPAVPNYGDMTRFREWPDATLDVLVGGTPCQSFSVAGLRKGLDDPRGNLALVYLALADRYRPRWLVWENVPGVLSSNGGRDFGAFLGGLAQLGYGFAYRVLDARYFGVPQRRRRVFVVGHLGDWRRAAAVLFERASLSGHPAPRGEAREGAASGIEIGPGGGRFTDVNPTLDARAKDGPVRNQLAGAVMVPHVARCDTAREGARQDWETETILAHALRAEGFDASEDGTGRGTPIAPVYTLAIRGRGDSHDLEHRCDGTANAILTPNGGRGGIGVGAVAFDTTQVTSKANRSNPKPGDPCHPLAAGAHPPAIAFANTAGATNPGTSEDGTGRGTPLVPIDLRQASRGEKLTNTRAHGSGGAPGHGIGEAGDPAFTVSERGQAVAFNWQSGGDVRHNPSASGTDALTANQTPAAMLGMAVRRLTPEECEALQGVPRGYTAIPYRGKLAADGPRYKALGNSMAVPCMRWIGGRIATVDSIIDIPQESVA